MKRWKNGLIHYVSLSSHPSQYAKRGSADAAATEPAFIGAFCIIHIFIVERFDETTHNIGLPTDIADRVIKDKLRELWHLNFFCQISVHLRYTVCLFSCPWGGYGQ